ncbi:Clustered mitochondria-like protein [Armadillidium nasatum]|uniref:Clustered mitochondria protein homolog n=1 Tax=Armadillidium nasatum TaxID=96803 RepID=A0A5N5SLX7_9CRUS|nr:Clustered mitochondria-like protein [Armadillidium nasatum]
MSRESLISASIVSSMELVQEIHQLLMDREDTCHRTCFYLMFGDTILDNFSELKSIEGLKEGSKIKVVEQQYTMREARIHVRHIKDVLKSLDSADAYNGLDCASLSFLNTVTQGDILGTAKKIPLERLDCTPPDYILPSSKDRPLTPLQPFAREQKSPKCLKVLNVSGWNPPPGPRKVHGDLLYLYVVTLEGKRFHITACTWGFFVNQSTDDEFNPKPANPCYLSHSLVDLLNHISSMFKRNFANLLKKRTSRHPFERVPTPYQVHIWTSPHLDHSVDSLRAEDACNSKLGYEEHIPGQTRDWNEELQTTRELPRLSLPERLLRERAIFKVHSDFVSAATKGSVAVVEGNVMAINPGEDPKMQMFIWNNIFFSLGFDVKDHYKEIGGDAAAYVAPRNDLQGVKAYNALDLEGLHTLGTVLVDYRGYRVTAQSIIPGILEREQEQSVVYGSTDFGKTVVNHPKYNELLKKASNHLKILPHKVISENGEEIELFSSIECKGIIGNDGRHYILDLLRTFPPDANFLPHEDIELSTSSKQMGFPLHHQHKLAILRQELIDAFVDNRYMLFLKYAALHLQLLSKTQNETIKEITEKDNDTNDVETEVAKKMVEKVTNNLMSEKLVEKNTKEVIKKAAEIVGSLKEADFDVRFNPDVFSPLVKHATGKGDNLEKEKKLVVDAADFLVTVQIPNLIKDLSDHVSAPSDGVTLIEALHSRGINVRYLGKITHMLLKIQELKYISSLAVSEVIVRSAKHIFINYVQNVETIYLSSAVSHFLNCFLSSCNNPHPPIKNDELVSKKKKRKQPFSNSANNDWQSLSPKSLWSQIKSNVKSYFDWNMKTDSIDVTTEKYGLQKVSLLRSFCLKCGLQVVLRDFHFDSRNAETFKDEDIVNMYPVVKHINPRATDAYNLYTAGQNKIQQGYLKDGYELIAEALNLLNNVYGAMHPEIAQCLRMIARINYLMGDNIEAMAYQQKATLMSERVNGIDSPYTITEYTHLALYCFATHQVSMALKLLYRARYLLLIIFGENHPEVALVDSNIGVILYAVMQYPLALQFFEKALEISIGVYGEKSLKVALLYHLIARTQSGLGDFRNALKNEKETFTIYKEQLGPDHEKTKEADECLRHLTHQAVVMARKINEVISGKKKTGIPPVHIQPPAMSNVLELLNIINGILYIQISTADIEKARQDIEKDQLKGEKLIKINRKSITIYQKDSDEDEESVNR